MFDQEKGNPSQLTSLTAVGAEIGTFGFFDNIYTLGKFIRKLKGITIKPSS